MAHTICTMNVNNLFVRYRFGQTFPGDMSAKSAVENPSQGYLPMYNPGAFELFNPIQRDLAAQVLTRGGGDPPDVVCLQEVESLIALRTFNEAHLGEHYPHALLIDSRDLRQIDVAILSRLPILDVRSHVDDVDPDADDPSKWPWMFSRDCLEVDIGLTKSGSKRLTLFVNHLKSKFIDWHTAKTPAQKQAAQERNDKYRTRQAKATLKIVKRRFPGSAFTNELFAVVGDLNDHRDAATVAPLLQNAGLVDAIGRITDPAERWTHRYRSENTVAQLDHVLLSPALAAATDNKVPYIERRGISFERILADGTTGPAMAHFERSDNDTTPLDIDFQFPRFADVNPTDYASDHCAVFFDVP